MNNGKSFETGGPKSKSPEQAIQNFVERFNTYAIEQYMRMPHFPGNSETVSDLLGFDDSMNELDALMESGKISIVEYKTLQRKMNELGRLTHAEMVEMGEKAHLKIDA